MTQACRRNLARWLARGHSHASFASLALRASAALSDILRELCPDVSATYVFHRPIQPLPPRATTSSAYLLTTLADVDRLAVLEPYRRRASSRVAGAGQFGFPCPGWRTPAGFHCVSHVACKNPHVRGIRFAGQDVTVDITPARSRIVTSPPNCGSSTTASLSSAATVRTWPPCAPTTSPPSSTGTVGGLDLSAASSGTRTSASLVPLRVDRRGCPGRPRSTSSGQALEDRPGERRRQIDRPAS